MANELAMTEQDFIQLNERLKQKQNCQKKRDTVLHELEVLL